MTRYCSSFTKCMIRYCYVDTCVLSDILKQYNALYPYQLYQCSNFIKPRMLPEINRAVESMGDSGMILTSVFAFIEIMNKFNEIFKDTNIMPYSLSNFIKQPPAWITIENLTEDVSLHLCDVPLSTPNGESISGDDAIHIATALSRGEELSFCTTDSRLQQLSFENISFIAN